MELKTSKKVRVWVWGLVFPALVACATYQSKLGNFRDDLRHGKAAGAADKLKEKAYAESDDQVVYLFEYATAQQIAGNYAESTKAFLKAEDLTDIKDYVSISRNAGSLLLSDKLIQYKGEDFEKVLINGMLAVNFLMEGKLESAQVETRKLNDKLYKYRFEGKRNYQQNPFAFYLSAMIWETDKNWDSAYIDYKKAYELNPSMDYLKEDLIRAAIFARREDELEKWRKAFPGVKPADLKNNGELVLIYQQGWGPVKQPNPQFVRVPKLYPTFSKTVRAKVEIQGRDRDTELTQTAVSVTDVAIKQLDEQYSKLVAGRLAGIATKAVVADQLRQKNELLGTLAWIGMNVADQADLRQWLSLPASYQIAKLRLPPGVYKVRVVGLDSSNSPSGEQTEWMDMKVIAKKKTFMNWRSLQ